MGKTSHWYQFGKGRGSSTWQLFEPNFREWVCKGKRTKNDKGTLFGTAGNLNWPKGSTVVVKPDQSSKNDYCNNACSAKDKQNDLKADKLKVCKKSWQGFCRMLNFCPTKLQDAVDNFRERKKDTAWMKTITHDFTEIGLDASTVKAKGTVLATIYEEECGDDDSCDEDDVFD